MLDTDIKVESESLERFAEAMERLQKEFGKSPYDAVFWAASNLARSLSAGTKKAKEFPAVRSGTDEKKHPVWKVVDDINGGYVNKKYLQKRYTRDDVRRFNRRRHFGQAKFQWGVALGKLGSAAHSSAGNTEGTNHMAVTIDRDEINPSVKMEDGLRYAMDAFRHSGMLGEAVSKAANAMHKKLDNDLIKAMKK